MTVKCIRCEREVEECHSLREREYEVLTFHQERGALPICDMCFENVKDRDLWARKR
jgi:hypothetical protein